MSEEAKQEDPSFLTEITLELRSFLHENPEYMPFAEKVFALMRGHSSQKVLPVTLDLINFTLSNEAKTMEFARLTQTENGIELVRPITSFITAYPHYADDIMQRLRLSNITDRFEVEHIAAALQNMIEIVKHISYERIYAIFDFIFNDHFRFSAADFTGCLLHLPKGDSFDLFCSKLLDMPPYDHTYIDRITSAIRSEHFSNEEADIHRFLENPQSASEMCEGLYLLRIAKLHEPKYITLLDDNPVHSKSIGNMLTLFQKFNLLEEGYACLACYPDFSYHMLTMLEKLIQHIPDKEHQLIEQILICLNVLHDTELLNDSTAQFFHVKDKASATLQLEEFSKKIQNHPKYILLQQKIAFLGSSIVRENSAISDFLNDGSFDRQLLGIIFQHLSGENENSAKLTTSRPSVGLYGRVGRAWPPHNNKSDASAAATANPHGANISRVL